MSRRKTFLIIAIVIVVYFSLIIFMLRPLQGVKTFYGNNMISHLGLREAPRVDWCKNLQWRVPPSPNVVALVSFPGSGNTWLRYLLQQVTGEIY